MPQLIVRVSARRLRPAVKILLGVILLAGTSFAVRNEVEGPIVDYPLQFAVSPPVRDMPPQAQPHHGPPEEKPLHRPPGRQGSGNVTDPVQQNSAPTPAAAQGLSQWEGLGAGYPGYAVGAVPPDPNIAVGPNHVVQWVNNAFVVFNKQGNAIQAPVDDGTFWGANSTCNQLGGFSDPIVQYDRAADRWLIGEVAIPLLPPLLGQFAQCFAVSTTPDPTGPYNLWAYGFGTSINDYPKIGVWPDGYYTTWNIFPNGGATFSGPEVCAFDRQAMLSGAHAPARTCFTLSSTYSSFLPSDLDGANPPPAGSPNFVMDVDAASGALHLWKFHTDFVTPSNSTFTGPITLAGAAPFSAPCSTTEDCIPQPGTTQRLDAIGDRLMYRLAYRNFGDHESLVGNHTVLASGGNTAVRWYEVRSPNGTPSIYQQGTFAPDGDNRWMASIAMDQAGNIGVGYSVSSAATYPSIRYTGWKVGDPLGTLQAETSMVSGGGAQTGANRWGDYSAMRIDPSDDCTFWYTQEYQATTQATNWNTRIGSFKFSTCGKILSATTTALTSSPNPSTLGQSVTLTATVSPAAATGTVEFFDGATSLGTAGLNGGSASRSTSALAAGTHQLTATYSGDANYSTSTSSQRTQTVNSGATATTTSLASSLNPSTYGASVTFTATISSSSATGTVTFKDGATSLGTSPVAGGKASFATSTLAVGSHSITAVYSGDASFSGSTSPALSQTVNKANTTTALTSSPNPSARRQKVTFTATVSPSAATGTVQFLDGATLLGSATLSGGKASFATSQLAAGTHPITAKYGGSGNYNGSTSAVLNQSVTRR